MAHYKVILAYDGTNFSGFQRQVRGRTVQGVVESALQKLGWQGSSILASGRTDTVGQVVVFEIDWRHADSKLLSALNANLPVDVAGVEIEQIPSSFHPRFDATYRRYAYKIFCMPVRSPLTERYAWRVWPAVELEQLQNVSPLFLGTHDFAAFGNPPQADGSSIRCVTQSDWLKEGEFLVYTVSANAFLYHMVRRMVFLQVAACSGRITHKMLQESLERGIEVPLPGIAPAKGLVLMEVSFPAVGENND
jgi:tRNA pseudouridine38-40 synthase